MSALSDITIRTARAADAHAISQLVSGLSRRFIAPDYTPAGVATLLSHQTAESIARCINEGMCYLVAETGCVLVGAGALIRQ